MPVYRYSAEGVERIAQGARRQSIVFLLFLIIVVCSVSLAGGGYQRPLQSALVAGAICAIAFWAQRRAARRMSKLIESSEFELEGGQLTARNSLGAATIRREDVTQLRIMTDGILVRGKSLRQAVQLKPELDNFDDLVSRIHEWVPKDTPRIQTRSSLSRWTTLAVVGNMAVLLVCYTVQKPAIVIPACIFEVCFLGWCTVAIAKSPLFQHRFKLLLAAILVCSLSLLLRIYLLWIVQ